MIEEERFQLLAGTWTDREGAILHEKGESPTLFTIAWEIDLLPCGGDPPRLRLRRLDLVGRPVELPSGPTGPVSLTSAPHLGSLGDLGYDPESGEFSVLVPMLLHAASREERRVLPTEANEGEPRPARVVAMARFEGRFHNRLEAESEREVEMRVELRGLVALDEPDQDWDFVAPRRRRAAPEQILGPPPVAPSFKEVLPLFRGFVLEQEGTATPYPPLFCAYHAPLRKLTIQPVFVDARGPDPLDPDGINRVVDLPSNPHLPGSLPTWDVSKISGKSFETVMQRARDIWTRTCLEFDVLPPKAVRDDDFFVLNSPLEAGHFASAVKPDGKSVAVFVADSWGLTGQTRPSGDPAPNSVFGGGAFTGLGGTASAYILTVDSQIDIPSSGPNRCANGASGAVNLNHLAHEIGHVVGLNHPHVHLPPMGTLPASYPGTAGSMMEPSGYCEDSPSKNGRGNAELMHSPLLRTVGSCCGAPEIDDIVRYWWVTP